MARLRTTPWALPRPAPPPTTPGGFDRFAGWLGAAAIGGLRALLHDADAALHETSARSVVCRRVFHSGVRALPLVCAVAAGSGAGIVLQTGIMAPPPSGELGRMLVVVVLRELTPLVTAIVVAGHSGPLLAEGGGGRGADPFRLRVAAAMISTTVLAIYFGAVALASGYGVSQLLTTRSFDAVRAGLRQELLLLDLPLFALKAAGLGAIVAHAYRAPCDTDRDRGGRVEPGEAASRAFGRALVGCMVYSAAVAVVFYAVVGAPEPP